MSNTKAADNIKERRWRDSYPEIAAFEVGTEDMRSPELFAKERDLVFKRAWIFAGLARDVEQPGSYFLREFPAWKGSIIIVRGNDGKVRGFHNVCRHRANKLVTRGEAKGTKRALVCEYHGWTNSPEGVLTHMPDPDGVMNADGAGLIPVHTEVWQGFVFVNFEATPRETLPEFLGSIYSGSLSRYAFDKPWESWTWSTELKANWKVILDLFSESYHLKFVHQESVARIYSNGDNPFGH